MRYLWWAEFQKRGAIHYHAIIVDPPFQGEAEARHWFDAHWRAADGSRLAGIQSWVQIKSAAWFRSRGGDYVLKDVRKLNGKQYEQDYSRMPRGWRTFRSNQLAFEAKEHELHETKAWTICVAESDQPWHQKVDQVYVYRVDHHCPQDGGCRLYRRRRAPGRPPRTGSHVYKPDKRAVIRSAGLRPGALSGPGPLPVARQDAAGGTGCGAGGPAHSLDGIAAAHHGRSEPLHGREPHMARVSASLSE